MRAHHRHRLRLFFDNARSSLWFIPAIEVAIAIALSVGLVHLDSAVALDTRDWWWLFGGTAEGARELLSVVAGSLITVISVAFSLTIIAFQQAATQYTPRVLRTFSKDRGNQVVLGTYIATFVYSLLVLRQIRSAADGVQAFVPALAIFADLLLALLSLAMLIYFIHHVTESIQVSKLLSVIGDIVAEQVEHAFPERGGDPREPVPHQEVIARETRSRREAPRVVRSDKVGYVRRLYEPDLLHACRGLELAVVDVPVGGFVRRGTPLARCWGELSSDAEVAVRDAFLIDRTPSIEADVGFGLQQLVDIALKALSPAINDPATAEQCFEQIGTVLGMIVERGVPEPVLRDGDTRVVVARPTFSSLAEPVLRQLRYAARPDLRATLAYLALLRHVAEHGPSHDRREVLGVQAHELLVALPGAGFTPRDQELVHRVADQVLAVARAGGAAAGSSSCVTG